MVRTRHHPGTYREEEEFPVELLCMDSRSTRKSQKSIVVDYNSDNSDVVHTIRSRGNSGLPEDDHVQSSFHSRLRPKIRSSGAYFIGEEMTSDEESEAPRSRRSGKSSRKVKRQRSANRLHKEIAFNVNNSVLVTPDDFEDEHELCSRRRSTRQRKTTYSTLNQNYIDKAMVSVGVKPDLGPRGRDRTRSKDIGEQQGGQEEEEEEEREEGEHGMHGVLYEDEQVNNEQFSDMYSRVKRQRKHIARDMYGVPIQESGSSGTGSGGSSDEAETNNNAKVPQKRSYYLREHKPRTKLFEAPPIESQKKKQPAMFRESPTMNIRRSHKIYQSPARRKKIVRKRAAFHGSSSTSSSSESISDDEERFARRKAKSMARARAKMLPMNFNPTEADNGVAKDRVKVGASLADVDPMTIDRSITFDSIGGLGKHIRALKEMIVFPIMYPEIFERFKITPPRGVLFYGPPGTGKTLVARALSNECSSGNRRVAFFMRKGADCLSKWVGESERQLRMLFDRAYQMRPSIIFFDEIDGLAPVRSSRQDQIHSSIVSTLLALMDGLDGRGEIVVIGATNRIDTIDPALRRPGRFDREFLFPLPSQDARKQILKIQTNKWNPKLSEGFISELAQRCVGYCGADLKALCTEAALQASRRRYPQIYTSSEKLQLNVASINVSAKDFFKGMQAIVPTAQRSVTSPGRALTFSVVPLLRRQFLTSLSMLQDIFPSVLSKIASIDTPATSDNHSGDVTLEEMASDDDENEPSIFELSKNRKRSNLGNVVPQDSYMNFGRQSYQCPTTHRPRLLLCGSRGQGQTSHLGPAILHQLEQLPVHVLDLPTVFAASTKTPEESCAQVFHEARRNAPSIVYMPYICQWWEVLSNTLRATFLTMVQDLDPATPLLIVATSEMPYHRIDSMLQVLFNNQSNEVLDMTNPHADERREYFQDLLINQASKPPPLRKQAGKRKLMQLYRKVTAMWPTLKPVDILHALRILEVLPKAPPPAPAKLTETETKRLKKQEDATFRELRIFLRECLNKLGRDRKFSIFTKPVDIEDVPDYHNIIKRPMDLSTMMSRIDLHKYQSVTHFLDDINQICLNALEYNPDRDPTDRAIRHRACALRDTAYAIIDAELDPEFEKACADIVESRKKRGIDTQDVPPSFFFAKPAQPLPDATLPQQPVGLRSSRRVKGISAEDIAPLEMIEKQWQLEKRMMRGEEGGSPSREATSAQQQCLSPSSLSPSTTSCADTQHSVTTQNTFFPTSASSSSSGKKPKPRKKCIWASTKRRRRKHSSAKKPRTEEPSSPLMMHVDVAEVSDDSDSEVVIAESPQSREKQQPDSPSHPAKQLTPVARCLDLMPGHDSGVGSSLDSNGDSVDSIDHAKEKDAKQMETSTNSRVSGGEEETQAESSTSKFRITRSHQQQTKEQQQARDHLEEPLPTLVVDLPRLQRLLDRVVISTDNCSVERLERLYSVFSQGIFKHRRDYDKTVQIEELEAKLSQHVTLWSSARSRCS